MWMRRGSGESRSHPRSRKDVAVFHAQSNPKVPAEKQWDAEAQGPEHDGAFLEQVTC